MNKDVIIACDFSSAAETFAFLDRFAAESRKPFLKIGMELYYAEGPQMVRELKRRGHPIFLDLKPGKVKWVFDWLKRHNRSIVMSALGTDYVYYHACHDGKTYRYSDFMVGDQPSPYALSAEFQAKHEDNWKLPLMCEHSEHIVGSIDCAISCLWEYHECYKPLLGERLAYGGIPIDTSAVKPCIIDQEPEKVKFFIGIQHDRNILKGTDLLLEAAQRTIDRYPTL
jgi:hypothetical protein